MYIVRLVLAICFLLTTRSQTYSSGLPPSTDLPGTAAETKSDTLRTLTCLCFNELNTMIRDGEIGGNSARLELKRLLGEVREEYYRGGGRNYAKKEWVFPLEGYASRSIGGGRRHGYVSGTYDFFKGNRHGGHPSFDMFIRDRNQDSLDDRSGNPVKVLSLTGGIVVALEREWQPGSRLLGGRYVWVYDPAHELLVYYAHNGELSVELGDIVRPGDTLGAVGRSGWNAAKKRSPTHLHLTVLRVRDGFVKPLDVYRELSRSRIVPAL
jgi:hypothetical protein